MTQIKVLINPTAGSGYGRHLLSLKGDWISQETQPNDIDMQLENFLQEDDVLIIAGGDGTINLVMNGLYRTGLYKSIKLSLIPLGTGNDLANALGIKKTPLPQLVTHLKSANKHIELPLWEINNKVFTNYISWGLDAKILAKVTRWRTKLPDNAFLNKCLYFFAGLTSMFDTHKIIFNLNGQEEHIYALILANIKNYGGGCIVATSKFNSEPLLHCIHIRSKYQLVKLMLTRFTKRAYTCVELVGSVKVGTDSAYCEIDGELAKSRYGLIQQVGKSIFIK